MLQDLRGQVKQPIIQGPAVNGKQAHLTAAHYNEGHGLHTNTGAASPTKRECRSRLRALAAASSTPRFILTAARRKTQ